MNRTDTVHKQLERLMRGGLTIDEACSALRNLGFTEKEVRPLHTGIFRVTDVQLVPGRPHAAHEVQADEDDERRLATLSPEAKRAFHSLLRANSSEFPSLPSLPPDRGWWRWNYDPTAHWDAQTKAGWAQFCAIERARLIAGACAAARFAWGVTLDVVTAALLMGGVGFVAEHLHSAAGTLLVGILGAAALHRTVTRSRR